MNESYKELLTEYVGKKLVLMEEISDFAPEKLVLRDLFGFLTRARSNEVIMAKLILMVDAIRINQSNKGGGYYESNKDYYKAENKIGSACLRYLAQKKIETTNKE